MQRTYACEQTPKALQCKVQHAGEFRRFSLNYCSVASLAETIRSFFQLPISTILKLRYLDNEKDWIAFTTDTELQYAIEITESPLRISFLIVSPNEPTPSSTVQSVAAVLQSEVPCLTSFGCGRGRGRGGRGNALTKEERLALKRERISGRIRMFEEKLADPSLNADRTRTMTWKLSKLREKLESLNYEASEQPMPQQPIAHFPTEEAEAMTQGACERSWRCHPARLHAHHGCGRGRGHWGKVGRGEAHVGQQQGDHIAGKKWVVPKETWIQFQEAKQNLLVARQSGNPEAVKEALEAFVVAKKMKKEARYPKV